MFENRARKRRKNAVLLIVALILISAFGFGYYLNYGSSTNVNRENDEQDKNVGYKIPNSIRNPGPTDLIANADTVPEKDQIATADPENLIKANTKIIFKTYFSLCSHMVDENQDDTREFVNLSEEALKTKYPDWAINEFSTQQVILKREIQTYCPRHYIIGVKDGYIAIYVYNNDGIKTLYQMTDNPTSILTREDQDKLQYGIVADNDEELQQKLEGLSD